MRGREHRALFEDEAHVLAPSLPAYSPPRSGGDGRGGIMQGAGSWDELSQMADLSPRHD